MTKFLYLLIIGGLMGCTTNSQILRAVNALRADIARVDSVTKTNQILYNYEKSRIDSTYRGISDDELLRRIDSLTKPRPKN